MKHNKYWFKPKTYGWGATPTTWEGWLVVVGFIAYILSISSFLTRNMMGSYFLYFSIGIAAIIVISIKKTEGKWKWNWGKKPNKR